MPIRLELVVVCSALVLAGCSGGGDDESGAGPSAAESIASAAETPEELFDRVSAAATEAGSVRTTFTSSSVAGEVSGHGVVRLGPEYAADLTVSLPAGTRAGGELRALVVDETFYLQGGSEIGLPAGKTWIAVTADDSNPLAASLGPVIESLASAGDVEQSFAALKAGTELREDGQDDIDGVATLKYVVSVDVDRAVTEADAAAAFQALKDLGVTAFDYEIWVDGEDLPRQYEQTLEVGGEAGKASTTRANYTDWGTTVAISAPPAEQVTSLAELLGTG